MKLKDYIKSLQKLVDHDKLNGELEVVYAKDAEGNGYDSVFHQPTLGYFDGDSDFCDPEDADNKVNAVCIN